MMFVTTEMASIGPKNPRKPAVDKAAIRAAKIQALLSQHKRRTTTTSSKLPPAAAAASGDTKLPPARKAGQQSSAPPPSQPEAAPLSATASSFVPTSPIASARSEAAAAAAAVGVDQSNNPLTGHTYQHRAFEGDAAGNINHDRKRCKGHLHTIPATIVRGEGYPRGMLESTHKAEIQPHSGARPAQATLSTAKLWKLFPNGYVPPCLYLIERDDSMTD